MADSQKPTTVDGLRKALEELGLDSRGHKPELKKRLRKAIKQTNSNESIVELPEAQESKTKPPLYDYYLFFDVEATCEANGGFEFPNEIIEFPVVLVDAHTFEIVDEYRSYVKPTINPILTKFCLELTGIDQATVDRSPCFIDVLDDFQEFLAKWSLFQKKSAVFVTDGPFDIRDFITKQCKHSNLKKRPDYFCTPWINIRKLFREFYKYPVNKNIGAMLEALDMKFKGREHSGLDDSRNLVAIGRRMWEDGCVFKTNAKMRVVQKNHRKR